MSKRSKPRKNHPKDKHFLNEAMAADASKCPDGEAIIMITKKFNSTDDPVKYVANFNDRKAACEILKNLLFRWGIEEKWMHHDE